MGSAGGEQVVTRELKGLAGHNFRIRPAVKTDAEDIYRLIKELAIYEKEPDAVKINPETLAADGWPESSDVLPLFKAAMAEVIDDASKKWRSVGYALWFTVYSTWEGRTLWLEDLYVEQEFRGKGIGSTLIEYAAREARETNCERFQWYVLEWNRPSIEFYESLGARLLPEWRFVRMNRPEIAAFIDRVDSQQT
mmetsp:Transcript_4329/g.13082  ORF Transcript_4329/g.13082 Transcript_4329/m.13082 type:complete len:194 (-) Transcript_4329:1476-2057(-)